MSELPHSINLVVGDWSHDGHGLTKTITISSNLTTKEVESAYKKASKKIDIDLYENVCHRYQDYILLLKDWEKLSNAGMTLDLFQDENYEAEKAANDKMRGFCICPKDFAAIYCFMVKLGNPKFEYIIVPENNNTIYVGGYGLFE